MKALFGIFLCFILTSCATNHFKTIEGNWQQDFLSYKTQNAIVPKTNDKTIIVISKSKKNIQIEFDFNDGYEKDKTDSIVFNFPKLTFKKTNLDKSSNYYDLTYHVNCDCFLGEMQSFSGNILNIKLNRVSAR